MPASTPYQQLRQIGFSINRVGMSINQDGYGITERRAFEALRRNVRSAQDTLKDYEVTEIEEDLALQARLLPKAIKALERVRESLLKASEYDLIGAVDTAQISAELDELIDRLR
jgi:hypothetical protein